MWARRPTGSWRRSTAKDIGRRAIVGKGGTARLGATWVQHGHGVAPLDAARLAGKWSSWWCTSANVLTPHAPGPDLLVIQNDGTHIAAKETAR